MSTDTVNRADVEKVKSKPWYGMWVHTVINNMEAELRKGAKCVAVVGVKGDMKVNKCTFNEWVGLKEDIELKVEQGKISRATYVNYSMNHVPLEMLGREIEKASDEYPVIVASCPEMYFTRVETQIGARKNVAYCPGRKDDFSDEFTERLKVHKTVAASPADEKAWKRGTWVERCDGAIGRLRAAVGAQGPKSPYDGDSGRRARRDHVPQGGAHPGSASRVEVRWGSDGSVNVVEAATLTPIAGGTADTLEGWEALTTVQQDSCRWYRKIGSFKDDMGPYMPYMQTI